MRNFVLALDRRVTGAVFFVACVLLAIVSILGIWQVGTRFLFAQPSTWTEELMRRLLVWMVMLGAAVAFRHGALISVDLMLKTARGRWRTFVNGVITVTSLALLGVLIWYGIDLVWRIRFQTWASLDFLSMGWAYAAIPVGAAVSVIGLIAHQLDPVDEQLDTAQ
jgi:TRAP-type C4-dicarboxylate transport system permease small subunit